MVTITEVILNLLEHYGIKDIVVQKQTHTFDENFEKHCNFFTTNRVSDRRSMGYFAMGLSQEKNNPVAIFVEDYDAAVANLLPALTEAISQYVPLLICEFNSVKKTWLSNGYDVICDKCKASFIVDEVTACDSNRCNLILNNAILSLQSFNPGPVHLLITVDKDKSLMYENELYAAEWHDEYYVAENTSAISQELLTHKVCLLLDSTCNYTPNEIDTIRKFVSTYKCRISSHDVYVISRLISNSELDIGDCDLLLQFGDCPVPGALEDIICHNPSMERWLVTPEGRSDEVICKLKKIYASSWQFFLKQLCDNNIIIEDVPGKKVSIGVEWTVKGVASAIISSIDTSCNVIGLSVYGESLQEVFKNFNLISSAGYAVSTGGEGVLSMFIGQVVVLKNKQCLCFIDIDHFFRDMNALHIQHYGNNLGICVFAPKDSKSLAEQAEEWAKSCNFYTTICENLDELGYACNYILLSGKDTPFAVFALI